MAAVETGQGLPTKLAPEERERGLAAMAEARRLREELRQQRGGELFPAAGEDLNELRDERSRQLGSYTV